MKLEYHTLAFYKALSGECFENLKVSYQIFGQALHTAPVVLVHHALTGNSDVMSETKGWWKDLVGKERLINTECYTVIAFNIPGNGYGEALSLPYDAFCLRDVAQIFYEVLQKIGVKKVYASIGGSIGGAVAWELAALAENFVEYTIPIASDWKAVDWVLGYCKAQHEILKHSKRPLHDARIMAMLMYRTPQSLEAKFQRSKNEKGEFNISSWLSHHGNRLEKRFTTSSYLTMNHLLSTVNLAREKPFEQVAASLTGHFVQIGIDSDLLFVASENRKTHKILNCLGVKNEYYEIKSVHGHDAFLIENEQITQFLKPIFQ